MLFVIVASYLGYMLTSKEIEVDDKTVAIMFIENQTGEKVYDLQANNLIPQIYDKLFANPKNDIKFPSPHVKNQLKSMQESNSYDYNAAVKILNNARIKYRVTAMIQKSGDDFNYILETTKPGKHHLVWQETVTKPDTIAIEDFAQTLADWIEACVWVDWQEERMHKELNFPNHLTSREIFMNCLSKNIHASKAYYKAEYIWIKTSSLEPIPYYKKAWKLDPDYIVAATSYATFLDLVGQRQKGLNILEQLRKRSAEYTHFE